MADDADYAVEAQAVYMREALSKRILPPAAAVICDECTMPMAPADMLIRGGRKMCRECADY